MARLIGLNPEEARNIDVVAALFYLVLCRALLRASGNGGRADDRLVGMLQVLLKALDPSELRVAGPDGGPIPITAVIADVQTALGMRPTGNSDQADAAVLPYAAPEANQPSEGTHV